MGNRDSPDNLRGHRDNSRRLDKEDNIGWLARQNISSKEEGMETQNILSILILFDVVLAASLFAGWLEKRMGT